MQIIRSVHSLIKLNSLTSLLPIPILSRKITGQVKFENSSLPLDEHLIQKCEILLKNQGFNEKCINSIITEYPDILWKSEEKLLHSLECWRSTLIGEKNVVSLLEKHPCLFNHRDLNKLSARASYIRTFSGTNKNVYKLLMNSPNIAHDNLKDIEEKINYVQNVMKVDLESIVNSSVFSKSLKTIQCRHTFLFRLGLYKHISAKKNVMELNSNPKLNHIVNNSDKKFALNIASVTLEEYEVFRELYMREINLPNQETDDDDDDDDYDENI